LLVWIVAFICLIVSSYRAWLSEHRSRLAEKLDPLIEDVRLLREFWDKIHTITRTRADDFPLSGDVEKWEEVHKAALALCSIGHRCMPDRARWFLAVVASRIGEAPPTIGPMVDERSDRKRRHAMP